MKKFFTSKKAWALIMGEAGIIISTIMGVQPWNTALLAGLGLLAAYMVSQGVADIGKDGQNGSRY